MGRRIRLLGVLMMVCFALVVVQLVNIQLVKAPSLASSQYNPRVASQKFDNPRGTIYAADGTVLAKSVKRPASVNKTAYPYDYFRDYPAGNIPGKGNIYAGILGYDSPLYYGTAGVEEEYNSDLSAHSPGPKTLSQILFRQNSAPTTDNLTLTVLPKLQQAAWNALGDKDGAVVVLTPQTGAVEAMVSNPTYDPNAMANPVLSQEQFAYFSYIQRDGEGYRPLRPIATGEFFAPGSTFKVVTSTAAYNLKPSLAGFDYPVQQCQKFADSNIPLCDQGGPCGGTMISMLPESCDPGYAELGVQEGVSTLQQQAQLFGYDSVPGIDLPGVVASKFSALEPNAQADLGQSAIGQLNDDATALQNAMVASAIANGGVIMTPHVMTQIRDAQGDVVETYTPKPMPRTATTTAATEVTKLMEAVITNPRGTAAGVGFPSYLCAAVKTGTAQTSPTQHVNSDWMIGFAPANHPTVAIAVVVPQQSIASDGASVAGPIMKAVMEAALPAGTVKQPCRV